MKKLNLPLLSIVISMFFSNGCAALVGYDPEKNTEAYPQINADMHDQAMAYLCAKPIYGPGRDLLCQPQIVFTMGLRHRLTVNDADSVKVNGFYFDEQVIKRKLYILWKQKPKIYDQLIRDIIATNSTSLVDFYVNRHYTGITDQNPEGTAQIIGTTATQDTNTELRALLKQNPIPKAQPGYGYTYGNGNF